MALDSAWRRISVSAPRHAALERRQWTRRAGVSRLAAIWNGAQAFALFVVIVMGNIAIVKILDALLDRLRG